MTQTHTSHPVPYTVLSLLHLLYSRDPSRLVHEEIPLNQLETLVDETASRLALALLYVFQLLKR